MTSHSLAIVKALTVTSVFLFAFIQFMLAVRFYNHSAFLINVPQVPGCQITPEVVSDTVNRGARHYSIGMRSYYVAIPTVIWLLGPPVAPARHPDHDPAVLEARPWSRLTLRRRWVARSVWG